MTATIDGAAIRRGVAWSSLNSVALRAGTFVVGIVTARMLAPQLFGVYAVALTVQSVLMSIADLGLSSDLVRADDPERRAPTVATIGAVVSGVLAACAVAFSHQISDQFAAPAAAPAVAVLGVTLFLAGLGVVPYAVLLRSVSQRQLFVISAIDFALSTAVTLVLLMMGTGVMSLALGRVAAQSVTTVMQFVMARRKPRFSLDLELVLPILRFGLPVAGANLLSYGLLNVDNFVIARVVGATQLGLYVLAFNISSWPMSVISQVVRSITLPVFARAEGDSALLRAAALSAALAFPAGAALGALAVPLIAVVYGENWLAAAPVLTVLAAFGAVRVEFDVLAAFLFARGRSASVFVVQSIWFVVLVVGMLAVAPRFGITGAAWVHVVSALLLVLPMYLVALRRHHVGAGRVLSTWVVPVAGSAVAAAVAVLVRLVVRSDVTGLVLGTAAGVAGYGVIAGRWFSRHASGRGVRSAPQERHTVSVVIPCHNYARFLPAAVHSVLNQADVDVEVIVVDDASTDDSATVAAELASANPRVSVLLNGHNCGPVGTFNRGLAAASGEFLVRLDADDLLTPKSLSRAVALAEANPSVGLVYGHPVHFEGEPPATSRGKVAAWRVMSGAAWLDLRCKKGVNCITSPEVLMRRSVVDVVGGQRDLAHSHDMEMWMRIARSSDVGILIGCDQAFHREHSASLSATRVDTMKDFHERALAYRTLFTDGKGDPVRDAERHETARRALADEAILRFASATARGRGGSPETDAYAGFAHAMQVDLSRLPHSRVYRLALTLGPRRSPYSPVLVAWSGWNKINVGIKYRRWARTGL